MPKNQTIKCTVDACRYWVSGNNCDLQEIWVNRRSGAAGGLMSVLGGNPAPTEQDTFCASFDARR
jgi:hypothetical protein